MLSNNLPQPPLTSLVLNGNKFASSWFSWFGQLHKKIGGIGADTFLPTLSTDGTPGTPVYTTQYGRWQRIGNIVTINGVIAISSWGGSPTGNVTISGLPYKFIDAAACGFIGNFSGVDLGVSHSQLGFVGENGENYGYLYGSGSGSGVLASKIPVSGIGSPASLTFCITQGV